MLLQGPLLGNGKLGEFIDRNGDKTPWFYQDGAVGEGNEIVLRSVPPDLSADYRTTPVAVLTNSATASAGEVVVISFSGRPHTKRFGTPTKGLTTGNDTHLLSDGAAIILTEFMEADRTGHLFEGPILPDVTVDGFRTQLRDTVLEAAIAWLHTQCPF